MTTLNQPIYDIKKICETSSVIDHRLRSVFHPKPYKRFETLSISANAPINKLYIRPPEEQPIDLSKFYPCYNVMHVPMAPNDTDIKSHQEMMTLIMRTCSIMKKTHTNKGPTKWNATDSCQHSKQDRQLPNLGRNDHGWKRNVLVLYFPIQDTKIEISGMRVTDETTLEMQHSMAPTKWIP